MRSTCADQQSLVRASVMIYRATRPGESVEQLQKYLAEKKYLVEM